LKLQILKVYNRLKRFDFFSFDSINKIEQNLKDQKKKGNNPIFSPLKSKGQY